MVRIVRLDADQVNISARVEELAARYQFVLQPMSAGSPQENGFAEKAVGDATRLARSFMLGAPHLPRNHWGLAFAYVNPANLLLVKRSRGNRTAYEIIHHRIPHIDRMFIRVFGCPVQYQELGGASDKMSERTVEGWFVGLDAPSVLVKRESDGKVMRISPKKVRTHEMVYCKTPYSGENADYVVVSEGEDEIPVAVPSIKVLKPGSLYDSVSNQGESRESSSRSQGTSRFETAGTSARDSVHVRHAGDELDSAVSVEFLEEHEEIAQQEESGQIGELRDEHKRERDTDLTEAVAREVSSEQNPSPSGGAPSVVRPEVVREAVKASGSKRSGGARASLGGVMSQQRLALMKRAGVCMQAKDAMPAGKRVRFATPLESHGRYGRRAVVPSDSCISDARGVSVSMTLSEAVFAVRPSIEDAPVGSRVQTIIREGISAPQVFDGARALS